MTSLPANNDEGGLQDVQRRQEDGMIGAVWKWESGRTTFGNYLGITGGCIDLQEWSNQGRWDVAINCGFYR